MKYAVVYWCPDRDTWSFVYIDGADYDHLSISADCLHSTKEEAEKLKKEMLESYPEYNYQVIGVTLGV